MAAVDLPSQLTWSGKKMQKNLLTSEDPSKGMIVTSGKDSLLKEILLDHVEDKKATVTPHKTVPSPGKNMEKKSLTSTEYRGSLSRGLRLSEPNNKIVSVDPGHDADLRENVRNASILTTVGRKLDSLFMEKAEPSSPFTLINHSKDFTGVETTDGRKNNPHGLQDESGAIGNFQTPLSDRGSQNFQSMISDGNLQIATDTVRFKKELPGGGIIASSCSSASLFVNRGDNKALLQKKLVELFTQSPSSKELCTVAHNDRLHSSVVEDALFPNASQLRKGFENFSAWKRRREEMISRDSDLLDEIARIQRTPKLHIIESCDSEFLSEHRNESNTETCTVGRETRLEHWVDVFSKLSADKQLISPSIDKLNLQAIGVLEDILVNLWSLQINEMLCIEVWSQQSFDNLSSLKHTSIVEMKLLLLRIVHEQAKLQLMCVKRERLLKKVRLLSSGIQESQMLKLNSLPPLSISRVGDALVDDCHLHSLVNFKGMQQEDVAGDKVTALRQVLDASERKIMSLNKSFHTSCKIKGEPSCADTILLVNDHLKKKACCRFIRLDLQLWEVDNVEVTNVHHNIIPLASSFKGSQ